MSRRKALMMVLLACLALPVPAMTQSHSTPSPAARPSSDIPVTSTLTDYFDVTDSSGEVQRIFTQIASDGAGIYPNSSYVQSIIQTTWGNWYLTTGAPTRYIFLDFRKPLPGTGPNGGAPVAPFNSALIPLRLVTKCDQYDVHMLNIPVGTTVNCPLAVLFSYAGKDYLLQMNPLTGYVAPETDFVNITCNGAANAQCNSWTIKPNGAKGGCLTADCSVMQNVARLFHMVSSKGKSGAVTPVNQGNFHLTFSVSITNP